MSRRRMHRSTRMFLIPSVVIMLSASTAQGQPAPTASPQESPPNSPPDSTPPLTMPASTDNDLGPLRPGPPALLREGSLLVDVQGRMRFDEDTQSWRYVIDEEDQTTPGYEFTLLPNTVLQEMIELRQIAQGHAVAFEASGRILVYRGRNYFLPLHAPQLVKVNRPDRTKSTTPDAPPAPSSTDLIEDDSIEAIKRDLERAVGPVARSRSASVPSPGESTHLLAEGTMLVSRRGYLSRTAGGSWKIVFDADASGLSDPPMTIIPCLLLERMEQYVQRQGGTTPLIISGQVLRFNNHNYLYPSLFQIPRERTRLTP